MMLPLIEDVVGLAILALVLVQQLRPRPVRRIPYLGGVLAVIGSVALATLVLKHVVSPAGTALLLTSLAVTAVLGIVRGLVTRVWWDADRGLLRQGGALTVILWLVAIAQHIGADLLLPPGVGIATLSLFFGVSLVSQVVTIGVRSRGGAAQLADQQH